MMKRLNARDLTLIGFHAIALALLLRYDGMLYHGFHDCLEWMSHHAVLKELVKRRHWEFFQEFGSGWAAALIWFFIWKYDDKKKKHFVPFLISLTVVVLLYIVLQHTVGKIRPTKNHGNPYYFPLFWGWFIHKGLAFPSGHATFAFCLGTFLAMAYPKRKVFFYGLATLCSLARVVFEAHFFSDIYAGGLIGFYGTVAVYHYYAHFRGGQMTEESEAAMPMKPIQPDHRPRNSLEGSQEIEPTHRSR